jgi:hypothetical protein
MTALVATTFTVTIADARGTEMKKILLGATALSMMGVAGGAAAQEWSASTSGFMTIGVGIVESDAFEADGEIVNNSEVNFNFRLVADNGLTFSVKGELENNGAENNMDEYVGRVSGSFGTIEIGAEDGATDRLHGGPAGETSFTAIGDGTGLLCDWAADNAGCEIDTDAGESGDALKITYFTPTFAGFQAGASWSPTGDEGGTSTDGFVEDGAIYELGANYSGEFSGFSIGLGGGAAFGEDESGLDNSYGGSLNIGFSGWAVGGSIGFTEDNDGEENAGYAVGANYATGPWLFGMQFAQGLDGDQEDQWGLSAGIDYALAPGVTVGATAEYLDAGGASVTFGDSDPTFTVDTAGNVVVDEPADPGTTEEVDDAFAFGLFMNLDY